MSNQTAEAKIFEGCKHPELIDQYIEGVKDGAVEQRLTALKEEIDNLEITKGEAMENPSVVQGFNIAIEKVLNLIETELQ